MIRELETVVLLQDVAPHDLKAGDVGAVVHRYGEAGVRGGIRHRRRENASCADPDGVRRASGPRQRDTACPRSPAGVTGRLEQRADCPPLSLIRPRIIGAKILEHGCHWSLRNTATAI